MDEHGNYPPVYSGLAANAIVALPRRKAQRMLDLDHAAKTVMIVEVDSAE